MALEDPQHAVPQEETPGVKPVRAQRGLIGSGFRVVSFFTLLSRVSGLARDMVMAGLFGAGPVMDAFSVAFRIPNLARRMLGEGAMTTAYLPVFVRERERHGAEATDRLTTAMFVTMSGVLVGIVLLAELLLVVASFGTTAGSNARLLIVLTAEMLPFALLMCLVAQLSAVLHSMQRFAWPAFAPVILNLVWIVTALGIAWMTDDPLIQIHVIAAGVVISGVLELFVVGTATWRTGIRISGAWRQAIPRVREVFQTMMPILAVTWIFQMNTLLDSLLAWGLAAPQESTGSGSEFPWPLEAGTASALYFAQRMYQFPMGVFSLALGTVLFPLMSRHVERGELDQVGRDLSFGMRVVVSIGIPASVGLGLLSGPISVLFFERGAFTSNDAALTARCIAAYGAGVWAYMGLSIIHRGFFALNDRRRPLSMGLLAVGLNVILNLTLIWVFAGMGLALATAIAAIVQFVATVWLYQKRNGLLDLHSISRTVAKTVVATLVMSATCLAISAWVRGHPSLSGKLLTLLLPMLGAIAAYTLSAIVLRIHEPFNLIGGRLPTKP